MFVAFNICVLVIGVLLCLSVTLVPWVTWVRC